MKQIDIAGFNINWCSYMREIGKSPGVDDARAMWVTKEHRPGSVTPAWGDATLFINYSRDSVLPLETPGL